MHIKKYDFNYGRRQLMKNVAAGAGAGVLMPLSKAFANEMDVGKAYPDELMSIEAATKGKIKVGDILTSANVEHVKHLLDPIVERHFTTYLFQEIAGELLFLGKFRIDMTHRQDRLPAIFLERLEVLFFVLCGLEAESLYDFGMSAWRQCSVEVEHQSDLVAIRYGSVDLL